MFDLNHQPVSPGSEALLGVVQSLHLLMGLRALGVADLSKEVVLILFMRLWGVGSSLPG